MGRYSGIITKSTVEGKRYKKTVKYPDIPLSFDDIYVYTEVLDRFDMLAQSYYGDPQLWWVISMANPQLEQGSIYPPAGIQIRIPGDIGGVILSYEKLNGI